MKRFGLLLVLVATLSMTFVTTQVGHAQTNPPALVAWWEFSDASDSAPGGTRPFSLLDGATLSDIGGDTALVLDTDPSNNRGVASAFNPVNSFSVFVDFKADTVPTGSIDPQYVLLSNIGDDTVRTFTQFELSPGYMVYQTPTLVIAWQKTAGSFTGARSAALSLADPTGRHTATVNWAFSGGQFAPTIFLDGSGSSATSAAGPMDFSGGETSNLLLGTNVDEQFQPPRTLDGALFEVAIFDGLLTTDHVDALAAGGVSGLLGTPAPVPGISGLGLVVAAGALAALAWTVRGRERKLAD